MLQAIVLVLKIFGITLLAILAFLLSVLLLALFCPVRYRMQGDYDGRGQLRGNVSWLFHLVSLGVRAEGEAGNGIRVWLRIFGIPVWDSSRKREKSARKAKGESQNRGKKNRIKQEKKEKQEPGEDFQKDTGWKGESQEDKSRKGESQEDTGREQGEPAPQGSPPRKKRHQKRKMGDRLRQARNKIHRFREEWKDRRNRAALRLLKAEGRRLLRHIAPRKLRIRVWYGFENPATTGRVLGFLAMIYPLFRGNLQIYPDFEQPGFKLEFAMKGRLFGAVFITSFLKLMFNKDVKHMIRKFR